jgi:peptide/nickel transport system substrate-binding protein
VTDPKFRRALREAVDGPTLVNKILLGYGTPGLSPVSNTATTGPWSPPPGTELPFNLQKAKADLAAAGYVDTDGNGIVNDPVTHKDVVLRYYIRTTDQNTIKTAPYVQAWFKAIGVGTKVTAMTGDALTNQILAGTYDMFDWDWIPNPDPNGILAVFTCGQRPPNPNVYRSSDSYYCNPQFDKTYDDQQHATDSAQRNAMVHSLQDMLWNDMPYIVMYNRDTLEAYRSDLVTGFLEQPATNGDLLATFGPLSFINIHPPTATSAATSSSSSKTWLWILLAVVVLAVIAIVVASRRRRAQEDEA